MVLLKSMIEKTLREIRDDYPWPQMQREYTFTLATGAASYAHPGDFNAIQNETVWNRTQTMPLIGPVDEVMWQNYKSGLITTLPRQRFRVKGWSGTQLFIDPTPTSSENGQTVAYEYLSSTIVRPKTWTALTSWTGFQYCSYNGNIYDRGGTGAASTGSTPPTHTTGAASDGVISWTYRSNAYETIVYDSDEAILDEKIILDGTEWRFRQSRGFDYEVLKQSAEQYLDIAKTKLEGAGVASFALSAGLPPMIGRWSYPEGSY